jgi:hypothetical protein
MGQVVGAEAGGGKRYKDLLSGTPRIQIIIDFDFEL